MQILYISDENVGYQREEGHNEVYRFGVQGNGAGAGAAAAWNKEDGTPEIDLSSKQQPVLGEILFYVNVL